MPPLLTPAAGVDTGFNHLVRPTMYGSYHAITNLSNPSGEARPYYVAGNICESGDVFTRYTPKWRAYGVAGVSGQGRDSDCVSGASDATGSGAAAASAQDDGLDHDAGSAHAGGSDENRSGPRLLAEVRVGDVLALHTAGAYGYAMASGYNSRPRPAEVLIEWSSRWPGAEGGGRTCAVAAAADSSTTAAAGEGTGGRHGSGGQEFGTRLIRRAQTVEELVSEAMAAAGMA
jgi:hypothetical protein